MTGDDESWRVNPLLQFGLEETRKTLCENILTDLSVISYVPFDSSTIGNPALDLGDVLTFPADRQTGHRWLVLRLLNIESAGSSPSGAWKNPRLAQG